MEIFMRIKNIALIGMMSAILMTFQVALNFLPNIELVSLLIILYTLIFGKKTIYIIYVFVFLEGFIYGFGIWWFNYLYVWTVLFVIVLLFRRIRSPFIWSVISGIYGLCFGALCSIPYYFTSGISAGFAYWIAGIPFDLTHGFSNFVVCLTLFYPLHFILKKVLKQTDPSEDWYSNEIKY
jgi:energy-coupling factor transport system substrate-specific component